MFKNKDGKVRSGWKILLVTGVFFAITLIIQFIIGIIAGVFIMAMGGFNTEIMDYTEQGYEILNRINKAGLFIQEICMIFTPIVAWKLVMKRKLSDMGLTSLRSHKKELLTGLLFGAISFSVVFILFLVTGYGTVETWKPHFTSDTVIYLVLFILVGLAEEIFGRGFIMSVLKQTKNMPIIIIVSSVIFALLHSTNQGIGLLPYINLTLVGVLFAYMYIKSGNLWMCIGYHITWNYFQGNVYGFHVSGIEVQGLLTTNINQENIFSGKGFGPEGGLFVTIVILFGLLFVKMYYKNTHYDFLSSEKIIDIPAEDASVFMAPPAETGGQ